MHSRRGSRGFTLLETTIALVLTVTLGYSLVLVLGVGYRTERSVLRTAAADQDFRRAVGTLTDELRASRDSTVSVETLADGNHQVRFQLPIVVGGATSWGVHDPTLGSDPASQDVPGWSVRYTVRNQAVGGATSKQLVRQVLDDALTVRKETVLAGDLRGGNANLPGFRVVKTGAVWEISLATGGLVPGQSILSGVFHVRTRN